MEGWGEVGGGGEGRQGLRAFKCRQGCKGLAQVDVCSSTSLSGGLEDVAKSQLTREGGRSVIRTHALLHWPHTHSELPSSEHFQGFKK